MNHQHTNFGPWTTSLDSGSRLQLSTFWKQRMRRLPGLVTARQMSRRTLAVAWVLAIAVGLLPLVELVPAAPVDATAKGDFVATFSNSVSVELIGLSENPSAEASWWKPDGTPLGERPYHRIMAEMGSPFSLARELCWRWRGIDGADVQTNWGTVPAYNGAGGGHAKDKHGKNVEGLTAQAISMAGSPDTCTVKLSISLPATPWETQVETEAGNPTSIGKLLPNGESAAVSFMVPRVEGNDTLVTVGYKIPGEVRLAALDVGGDVHIGKSGGGGGVDGFAMREVRFVNVKPADLKTWQLQTRQRKTETVEFRNVSLHRGKVTDVEMVEKPLFRPAPQPSKKQFSQIIHPGLIEDRKTSSLATRATDPTKGERDPIHRDPIHSVPVIKAHRRTISKTQ